MPPKTLLELAGVTATPARLSQAVIVVIDAQQEYVDGQLPLTNVTPALDEIGRLLERARSLRTPVIHIVHHAKAGKIFAPGSRGVDIAPSAAPAPASRFSPRACRMPLRVPILPTAFARCIGRRSLRLGS